MAAWLRGREGADEALAGEVRVEQRGLHEGVLHAHAVHVLRALVEEAQERVVRVQARDLQGAVACWRERKDRE